MDLSNLKAKGAFVASDLVKEPVEWKHTDPKGNPVTDKFDVFVRRVSFGVLERAGQQPNRASAIVAACICFGEHGDEGITYEEACALDPSLATELVDAVNRVNKVEQRAEEKR